MNKFRVFYALIGYLMLTPPGYGTSIPVTADVGCI